MPNKKNRNSRYTGFYVYMQEIMPTLKREGRVHGGIDQVVPVARPMWKALSKQEQDKYDRVAKENKRKDSNNMFGLPKYRDDTERMDNVGNIIAHREVKEEVNMEQRARDRRYAKTKWPDFEEMVDFPFYFLGFEYLCELDVEKEYIPIEVSVLKWSMKEGIIKYYHKFVDPGPIPVGYRYTCQHHSEETHQIPIDGFELADNRYTEVWGDLEDFINPRGDARDCPPLYCAFTDWKASISMLEWLYARSRVGRRNLLEKVFVLEDCVQDLVDLAGQSISQGAAEIMLQSSAYDYEPNTTCSWHEEKEVRNCALGTVKKYGFAFADYFSAKQLYDFELKPQSHLPARDSTSQNHTTIQPDRMYMEPQGVSGVSRYNPPSVRGAASAQNNGPYASRDIRYKQHDKVEINLDEESCDDDDLQSQYSYASKIAASSYSDADRPKSAWTSYIPQIEKPNIKDSEEFPNLGGDGSGRFASRAGAPPPNSLPQPSFSGDGGDSWKPSAAYMEQKHMREQQLATLPSLEEKVKAVELNNNSSIQVATAAPANGKPREINSSMNNWAPKPSVNKAPAGRGTAVAVGRGRGLVNFGTNPWAKGATRATTDKAPAPIGIGRGRGRGSWVPKTTEAEVGARPSSPTGSMTSQASSSTSSIRPPPGFGRGLKNI